MSIFSMEYKLIKNELENSMNFWVQNGDFMPFTNLCLPNKQNDYNK